LPAAGPYAFDYAGAVGVNSRWVAAKGGIYYSADFGVTWEDRGSNSLLFLSGGLMNFDIVKVLEY
jgi:hypothetical protein